MFSGAAHQSNSLTICPRSQAEAARSIGTLARCSGRAGQAPLGTVLIQPGDAGVGEVPHEQFDHRRTQAASRRRLDGRSKHFADESKAVQVRQLLRGIGCCFRSAYYKTEWLISRAIHALSQDAWNYFFVL